MGGCIWVEDGPDREAGCTRGSLFHFTAVFAQPGDHALAPTGGEPAPTPLLTTRTLHILLADDERINRILAAGLLKQQGWRVSEVENGRQALEAMTGNNFDLVLMDLEMPEIDGLEVTRRFREQEIATGNHLPIIAITAHAITGYREQCLAAGMDDYLSKPFELDKLLRMIARLVPEAGARAPEPTASPD